MDFQGVNAAMVRDGQAYHFEGYSDDPTLAKLEIEAGAAQRGLWSDARPVARWDWRTLKDKPEAVMPTLRPQGVKPRSRDQASDSDA